MSSEKPYPLNAAALDETCDHADNSIERITFTLIEYDRLWRKHGTRRVQGKMKTDNVRHFLSRIHFL